MRPPEKSNTHSNTTQATLVETKAVAAQAGCVREDLGQRPPVRYACVGSEFGRVRVQEGTGDAGRPKTHVRGATPGELTAESSRGLD